MAGAFDLAQELLNRCQGLESWVRANEVASILWMKGEQTQALQVWKVQPANAVISLNRGMARLFLGDKAAAKADLQHAAQSFPETSSWKHLAQLYLSLCGM
jgi:Flp pilus assembly protein TadD